jgi:hypothetical protein
MNVTTLEPAPVELGPLVNFESRMLRSFRAAVEDWDEVCSALGAWEARHLAADDAGPDLQEHRRWVTELLGWGQRVLQAMQLPGFPDRELAARVAARVRHLEDKLELWHGAISPEEEQRIVQAAFA